MGQYHDVLVANGDAGKSVWFTEFGYYANPTPPPGYEYCTYVSEDAQARFLARAVEKARELPFVGAMIVWNLNFQQAVPQSDEKWGFGTLHADLSPRPACNALAALLKT